jgi:ABC-type amino acid transport substrate-binding protein
MLQSGRVDAVVTNKVVGEYILSGLDTNLAVKAIEIEEYKLPVYLAFKKDVIDINNVNAALLKIKNSIVQK